ncbi:hypothetical protein KI387_020849, partial [Taxus chinensis]
KDTRFEIVSSKPSRWLEWRFGVVRHPLTELCLRKRGGSCLVGGTMRYVLELRPGLEAYKFDRKLDVTLDVVDKTKYPVLNASDLVIKDKSASLCGTASIKVKSPSNVGLDAEDKILVIEFDEALPHSE